MLGGGALAHMVARRLVHSLVDDMAALAGLSANGAVIAAEGNERKEDNRSMAWRKEKKRSLAYSDG